MCVAYLWKIYVVETVFWKARIVTKRMINHHHWKKWKILHLFFQRGPWLLYLAHCNLLKRWENICDLKKVILIIACHFFHDKFVMLCHVLPFLEKNHVWPISKCCDCFFVHHEDSMPLCSLSVVSCLCSFSEKIDSQHAKFTWDCLLCHTLINIIFWFISTHAKI